VEGPLIDAAIRPSVCGQHRSIATRSDAISVWAQVMAATRHYTALSQKSQYNMW